MVAFHGAYHGMTHGALSLMGNLGAKTPITGLMSDVHFLPYPYQYRCTMSNNCGSACDMTCSKHIEDILTDDESGIPKPAGIIIEAVQGEGGKIPAPDDWMRELRRITKEQGIPLILDEIQAGIGRTGKMFAFEHSGIMPDVVLLSKAVGGTLPMAVVVYHKDLDKWGPGAHAGTFRGNQLGMATGTATLKYIREHKLAENAEKMGAIFFERLRKMQLETYCIGDVRGRGLMIGVELVNDRVTKDPASKLCDQVITQSYRNGLLLLSCGKSTIRFMPPLMITQTQVDEAMAIFSVSLRVALASAD